MVDPTTSGLRDVSTPQLYRRNAFRITGLPTDADRRTVRQRRQKVTTLLAVGAGPEGGPDGDLAADSEEVARAFDLILGDPRRRLVDELFWWWDTDDSSCPCPAKLHQDHDAAVRAHSAALDREAGSAELTAGERDELDELWDTASTQWGRQLRRAAFWDHVRHRVRALDDKQLGEDAVDLLRAELPAALVKPVIQLAAAAAPVRQGRLSRHARGWPAPKETVHDLLEQASAPLYEGVETDLRTAAEDLAGGSARNAATVLRRDALPKLDQLGQLVPADEHRRTARIRNDVALAFNNCAVRLIDDRGPSADRTARPWLLTARRLATDPQTIMTIDRNTAALAELVALSQRTGPYAPGSPVARMLDEMERRRRPVVREPWRPRRGEMFRDALGALFGRTAAVLVLCGLVGWGLWRLLGADESPSPVNVVAATVAHNAPKGTCIATKQGWEADKTKVPSVPCDQEHWGEVLGYVLLGGPSEYPGDDAASQLAGYECAWLRASQGIASEVYLADAVYTNPRSWNTGGKKSENYTTCVLHRPDNRPLPDHNLVDPKRPSAPGATVTMSIFNPVLGLNPPVGSCIGDRRTFDRDPNSIVFVPCEKPHWGVVVGYPVLYAPAQPWPGDRAVFAAADAACRKLSAGLGLDDTYRYQVTWPSQKVWDTARGQRKYTACTISKADDSPIVGALK